MGKDFAGSCLPPEEGNSVGVEQGLCLRVLGL